MHSAPKLAHFNNFKMWTKPTRVVLSSGENADKENGNRRNKTNKIKKNKFNWSRNKQNQILFELGV